MSRKFTVIKYDDDIFSNDPDWIIDYKQVGKLLTEKFMEKFKSILNWVILSRTQKLSIDFIFKNVDILPLSIILKFQVLTSDFLRFLVENYNEDINWNVVVKHQILDQDFICEFINFMDIPMLIEYQQLDACTKKCINDYIQKRLIELDISDITQSKKFEELLYIYV